MGFLNYASGQTDGQTDMLITVLGTAVGVGKMRVGLEAVGGTRAGGGAVMTKIHSCITRQIE